MPRSLDHLVLPVASLDAARERYEALGFTVAPRGEHPFGTENACVYFPGGVFLEPLAVHDRETCEREARSGNVFVARDQAYRFRNGQDGFSALVTASENASRDHEVFRRAGVAAGDMLTFSRPFATPSGETGEASFRLAFAADLRAPDVFFFACQRMNVPAVDRGALENHRNGAFAIASVTAVEENPSDFQYLCQTVTDERRVEAHSFGVEIEMGNARFEVLTPAGFAARFGQSALAGSNMGGGRGPRLAAITFAVTDMTRLAGLLKDNAIAYREVGASIAVDPAPGQGTTFAFSGEN